MIMGLMMRFSGVQGGLIQCFRPTVESDRRRKVDEIEGEAVVGYWGVSFLARGSKTAVGDRLMGEREERTRTSVEKERKASRRGRESVDPNRSLEV